MKTTRASPGVGITMSGRIARQPKAAGPGSRSARRSSARVRRVVSELLRRLDHQLDVRGPGRHEPILDMGGLDLVEPCIDLTVVSAQKL